MNLLTLANKLAEELGPDRVVEVMATELRKAGLANEIDNTLDWAQLTARQSGHEQFVLIRVRP